MSDERQLDEDAAAYLRRLQEIRHELDKAERDIAAGRVATLADLDEIIREIRRTVGRISEA
jgi:hypothetical protein